MHSCQNHFHCKGPYAKIPRFLKGALMEPFRQLNFTERGLVTHFSIEQCCCLSRYYIEINCKIMLSLFASHFLTILPHIFNHDNRYCFNPNFFSPKIFLFLSASVSCVSFCFGWGLKILKGPQWGLFLKRFNKAIKQAPWGLAMAAMRITIEQWQLDTEAA